MGIILFHGQHLAVSNILTGASRNHHLFMPGKSSLEHVVWKMWLFICLSRWILSSWRCSWGKQCGNLTFKLLYLGAQCFPKMLQLSSFVCMYKTAHLCLLNWIWVWYMLFAGQDFEFTSEDFSLKKISKKEVKELVSFNALVLAAVFVSIHKKKSKLAQLIDAEAYR